MFRSLFPKTLARLFESVRRYRRVLGPLVTLQRYCYLCRFRSYSALAPTVADGAVRLLAIDGPLYPMVRLYFQPNEISKHLRVFDESSTGQERTIVK